MAVKSYVHQVAEVFGYRAEAGSSEALRTRQVYECPFLKAKCVKLSQHRDYDRNIPFGACSVWHRGTGASAPQRYIICPIRFIQNRRIFVDASRLLCDRDGTDIILVPEIGLPMGRIDYILSQYNSTKREVADFIVLEVMACSTTTTGDVLRSLHDVLQGQTTQRRLKYGINFRQVISRMMVQVLAKAYACEKWNKRMVWVIQDGLYRYMQATTKVDLQVISHDELRHLPENMRILFFVYTMDEGQETFGLRLTEIYGGTKDSFAKILEPMELPDMERLLELIRQKIERNDSAFALHTASLEGLARIAPAIVHESSTDYVFEE